VIELPAPALASLAIVGLDPAKVVDFPAPPGSRPAGFSAGPQPRPEGGDAEAAPNATIVVPGLLAHAGARDDRPVLVAALPPTTRERLAASVRIAPLPAGPSPSEPRATRIAEAPDPLLEGRTVYMVAIQMPNVTSYIGSWLVWFAVRDPALPGPAPEIQPPQPLHKVDPKYIAAAVAERIEGKVRLSAVIRKDGRVDSVILLRHLDDRLDRSAEEALSKWEFEPAFRAGRPVDVDAVFEIPFTLAPKNAR
jgi:TonB family protein